MVLGGGTMTGSPGRQSAGVAAPCWVVVCRACPTRRISALLRPVWVRG